MPQAAKASSSNAPERVIREAEFAKRLDQACDAHPLVPAKFLGRGTWIQRQLAERFDEHVSPESIRKWFSGESKPRSDKLPMVAQILEVDVAWLSLGVTPDLGPRERIARNAAVDGAVNLVAGLIQMDGGHPAFPDESNEVAKKNHVDLHAIIRGAQYDLHIALGAIDGHDVTFTVPQASGSVLILGVVRRGFSVEVYEITPEAVAAGERRGVSVEIPLGASLRRIDSFAHRL